MGFAKRALRYLSRKRVKTLILFGIMLLSCSLILSSLTIINAADFLYQDMGKKLETKLSLSQGESDILISNDTIKKVESADGINKVNRIESSLGVPIDFSNMPGVREDDNNITLHGYDDISADGPFAEQLLRLQEGDFSQAIIHIDLAEVNDLKIGDSIKFEDLNGETHEVKISGTYSEVDISNQGGVVTSEYKTENQIYTTTHFSEEYDSVFLYLDDPSHAQDMKEKVINLIGDNYEVSVYDSLYNKVSGTLTNTKNIASLMLYITTAVTVIVVILILSIWVRSRMKEVAILIAIGEAKYKLFLQSLMELEIIFVCAAGISVVTGNILADWLGSVFLESPTPLNIANEDIGLLLLYGSWVVFVSVLISLVPILNMRPRAVLAISE